jgi:hypothetical protein
MRGCGLHSSNSVVPNVACTPRGGGTSYGAAGGRWRWAPPGTLFVYFKTEVT